MDIIKELNQRDSLNELVNMWSLPGLRDANLGHCGDRLWLQFHNWNTSLYFWLKRAQLKQAISVQTYWVSRCNDSVTIFCPIEERYIDWWSWWGPWALNPGLQGWVEELCHAITIFKYLLKWKFIYIFIYFWLYWGFGQVYNHIWRFKKVSASSPLYF